MDADELARQAAEELMKDAKKFMNRREAEFRATQMKQPMKTNKRFLGNTLRDVVAYNKSQDEPRKRKRKSRSRERENQEKSCDKKSSSTSSHSHSKSSSSSSKKDTRSSNEQKNKKRSTKR